METHNTPLVEADIRLIGGLNERLFNLLASIEKTGSINQAARDVGLTYKGAWDMLERANNLSSQALIETATGGRQGGGTHLTVTGKALLSVFLQIQKEHQHFLTQINQRLMSQNDIVFLLQRFVMKASARNQFVGNVVKLTANTLQAEVVVALKGGDSLVAIISQEAAQSLALEIGAEVVALIKAPHITLVTDFGGFKLSARNQLQGVVSHIQKGEVNSEVILELKGGNSIAAVITHESLETLELAIGSSATAIFTEGNIMLGVAS